MWLLTNKTSSPSCFTFETSGSCFHEPENDLRIYYEGYILPRYTPSHSNTIAEEIRDLYLKHNKDLIKYLKGSFILIIAQKDTFLIFSDQLGIKKYFYHLNGKEFTISSDFKTITNYCHSAISPENMAVYGLTYHFIGGLTLYEDIFYNKPATILEYSESKIQFAEYWDPSQLISNAPPQATIDEIAEVFKDSINSCMRYYPSQKTSLSLTAGVDSRLIFSILKNSDTTLHTYTYGNPLSIDNVLATKIAADFRIIHSNHNIVFTPETFEEAAFEVVKSGQSLCSLHRAHRVKAIESEAKYGNTMFLGTMGGEFVKGANHDDYIISDFVFEFSQNPTRETLHTYLQKKNIQTEILDIDKLMNFFLDQRWCRYPEMSDFYALIDIAAGLHHAQNDILYTYHFQQVFTPFMDIDYLEKLFQSDYHFINKKRYKNNLRRRLENHRFASHMQKLLCPELLEYTYNTGFKGLEYLQSPIYAALQSRIRKLKSKKAGSFPLEDFMYRFSMKQLLDLQANNPLVNKLFSIERLLEQLNSGHTKTTESFWLNYTNPVQIHLSMLAFN